MKHRKPQQGNQMDCHAGPFNMNSAPKLSSKEAPSKQQIHRDGRFFKHRECSKPVEFGVPSKKDTLDLELNVAALFSVFK